MHPRTVLTLEKLEQAEWFSKVGVDDAERAIVLSSWTEAIDSCSSVEWENLCLEAKNQYCERIHERAPAEFQRWNNVAAMLKKATIPLVQKKLEAVVNKYSLPKVFEDTVQWDILGVCLEAEYADIYPPSFYASQAYWYVKGHFPCGWKGDFPAGTLVVY